MRETRSTFDRRVIEEDIARKVASTIREFRIDRENEEFRTVLIEQRDDCLAAAKRIKKHHPEEAAKLAMTAELIESGLPGMTRDEGAQQRYKHRLDHLIIGVYVAISRRTTMSKREIFRTALDRLLPAVQAAYSNILPPRGLADPEERLKRYTTEQRRRARRFPATRNCKTGDIFRYWEAVAAELEGD